MKKIENLLSEKTKDTKSEILYTQWSYDKEILPQALNSISNLFPHYSLHDESHSINIINNIIRILGMNAMEKLSAIDLWLILSASYYHDIGMVVSGEKLIKAINSDDFIKFFQDLLDDKQNSLYEFAKDFKVENKTIVYVDSKLSLKQHDGIKFILAEYFRNAHSQRSESIINSPDDEFNLASPRNVIPQRIFKTLGKICSSHTKSFDDVMKLSYCEVGIDTEDMHPRFVACLLRIGDLLDLDNNRFSEVMLSTLTTIPIDTTTHEKKHISIESFRADKSTISVVAKCHDYDVAEITQHWFDYINNEVTNQMLNWNKIVPSKEIGYLPSIDRLEVELIPYEFIDGKNKPKFSIDTTKALDLLCGAGLYDSPMQSFRELIQNAIDSTLIRIWYENKTKQDIFEIPYTKEFQSIVNNHIINISIESKEQQDDVKKWKISIEDQAMGISRNDLQYLMNAASSSNNTKKRNITREMPKWLKPSGIFGIGFQSIFQLTEKVVIETKDFHNEEFQIITMHNPNSPKNGAILLKRKDSNHLIKPGTKIEFEYETEVIPNSYTLNADHKYTKHLIDDYDYFSSDSFDIEIAQIIDEIFKFSENAYIPIQLTVDGDSLIINSNKKPFKYYHEETSLELNIYTEFIRDGIINTFYKNQKCKSNLYRRFIGLDINIHTDKASNIVTINRNEIKKDYINILNKNLDLALFDTIVNNYNDFSEDEKIALSMYLRYYKERDSLGIVDLSKYTEYKNHKILDINMTIEELQSKTKQVKLTYNNEERPGSSYVYYDYDTETNTLSITVDHHINDNVTDFLLLILSDKFKSISFEKENNKDITYLKEEEQRNPYSCDDYTNMIKKLFSSSFTKGRLFIPCNIEQYKYLRVKDNSYISWVSSYSLSSIFPVPKMLCPFMNKAKETSIEINEKLLGWVYENRYDEKTTREEIKTSYHKYIDEYKQYIDNTKE